MSRGYWEGWQRHAVAAAVAVVAAAPVMAQNTTSAVAGRVVDASGQPVNGATVRVVHNESGSASTTQTDAEGRYQARGLRVGGPYTITISKDGIAERFDDVFLNLAETRTLDAQLGATTTTIVVTGQGGRSDTFNRTNMGAGTNIGSRELNALASVQRNVQDYARTDPRISQTDKERGEISVAGQNNRFNSITIDGVKMNDTFGLESNNLPTLKQPISMDALQSVQVNVSNYDATQKGYTGANINAVTKSGTNEFKGSVYYAWRDSDWAGNRYNRSSRTLAPPPPFKEYTVGFTLGGPILQDKLFFFVNYEELQSSRNAPDFGPLGSSLTNVGISPALIAGGVAVARNTWGIDAGGSPSNTRLTVKDTTLKLDWNITDDHRASFRYNKTDQTEPIFPNFSTTALSLSTNWYDQIKTIETLVGQWFADWTPSFSTELKYARRDYDSVPVNAARLPQIGLAVTGVNPPGTPSSVSTQTRTLFFGTERSRHFNELRTKTDDVYLAANWQLGDHELKFGGDASRNQIFNAFLQDVYGNYTFRCVNSNASTNYTYNFQASVNCSTPAQVEAAILENFQRGRPFQYQLQVAAPGFGLADGAANWTLSETGAYIQDTWNVSKQLTLMAAVRVDTQSTNQRPTANTLAAAPTVAGVAATNTRQTGGFGLDNTATLDGEQLVQPRFGFNYSFEQADKRRTQVRGGFGLFQGAAASVWLSNPFSNAGVATRIIGCGGTLSPCSAAGGQFSPNPDTQPTSFTDSPAANVDFIERGLGQPSVWKANLAFETELPWYGLVGGFEWLHTKVKQGIYYQHLNLGPATRIGTDGRELYYNANGYDPTCWSSTGAPCNAARTRALNNSAYNNVLLASQTKKGGGNTFTLTLSQPVRDGLSWSAAYTRSTSKEVSPLTSSVANSNWAARSIFQPNEEVNANAAYLVRDRVNASLTFSRAFVPNFRTTFGVFYEGRRGRPYSWTFNNDLNGDGQAGNDLMYIPRGPGSGEVVFTGAGEDAFWRTVEAYPELNGSRGQVTRRNGSFAPFTNSFDLRISQEIPGLRAGHKGVISFDILNVGNLLNSRWGRIDEVAFQSAGGQARSFVNYGGLDSSGRYIYNVDPNGVEDLTTRQARGESQWAAQITLKYEF